MQEQGLGGPIRFGPFALDVESGELRKGATRLKVPDQSIEILRALLARPGHLVSREELRERLWSSDTFVDFDAGLNAAVKRLRDALGDTADSPKFIETLPRRGYRFIGVLDADSYSGSGAPLPTEQTVSGSERRLPKLRAPIPVATLVVVALAGIWMTHRRSTVSPVDFKTVPVTTLPGREFDPALSADGNQLAFAWDGNGKDFNIFIKVIGEDGLHQITTDPADDRSPSWSPDGDYLAFVRMKSNGARVVGIVPVHGGAEKILSATETTATDGPQYFNSVSWTLDGKSVLFADRAPGTTSAVAIFACSIDTGARTQLTFSRDLTDAQPAISADGRYLGFVRRVAAAWVGHVFVQRLDGLRPIGQPHQVTSEPYTGFFAWSDNRSIVYDSQTAGGLWRVAIDGGSPEPILLNENPRYPSVARHGTRIVFQRLMNDVNIWRIPGPAGQDIPTDNAEPLRIVDSTAYDSEPQFSFDGRRIAFVSSRSGSGDVWVSSSDIAGPFLRVSNSTGAGSPRWSPDGESIAFDGVDRGSYHVYIVSSQGSVATAVTSGASSDVRPSWSKNKQWIYFGSNRTGEWQIWKVAPDGTKITQVTTRGGGEPYESVDGRFVYYAKFGAPGIWRVPTTGGGDGEEVQVIDHGTAGYFGVTTGGIVVMNPLAKPAATIEFFDERTNRATWLRQLKTGLRFPVGATEFAVSRDGQWIVYSQLDNWGMDLYMLERVK